MPIKSLLREPLPPLATNFQGLVCKDGKNPAEFRKRKSKKKHVTFAPMAKDNLQGEHQENYKDMYNVENEQFSFQKQRAIAELEDDVELEDHFTVTTLLPPLPSLARENVGQQKSNNKKISFVKMKRFDVETEKPENRPRSFLKARPESFLESDVKREGTSEDDGLDFFESMNIHIDIADLADVLQDEVHTHVGSASEPELLCQASSPQHDETDHEAGLDFLNASLDQSYEESLNLQSNIGVLVCNPPGGDEFHEESSELGLDHQTPSKHSLLPPSPTPLSWMGDEILTDISAESMYESDFESDSEKPAPRATSPVSSEAFSKCQDELEKFERDEEERLDAESKDILLSLHHSLLEKREAEEKRMKEESAKELEDLQETLKANRERQEREIREENDAILEKVKNELKEEVAKTVQKLKARKKKGLDHLQAELGVELASEKERLVTLKAKQQDLLMQESRESFTSVHQKVEQEQRRTLERLSEDHENAIRKLREKHSEDKALLKEQLLSRFIQEKEKSAKELEELQETLKVNRERQALEIQEENVAILEKVKTDLKEELANTVQKLKARKKKRLDHLQAELEVELTSEKESFTSVRQRVEQEQRRTLERLSKDHEKEIRKLQEDKDLMEEQLHSRFNQEKEESAEELKELRDTLKEDRKRQEREIRKEHDALLEKVKTELKEEMAKTVQNLKARKKKRSDHLQAELEVELTSEKERLQTLKTEQQDSLMQESRESFTSVRQEVEQEQRRTLERLSEDHEKGVRQLREKHSEEKDLLEEQLLSRFNQEKEQREEYLALRLQEMDFQHKAEVLKRQRENPDKMLELKELPTELEVRCNNLESQDAEFKAKVERLSQRMSYLEEKNRRKKYESEERNMKTFPSPTLKEEVDREHRYLTSGCRCDISLDLLEKTNDELRTCREERENLVTMVYQLQRQNDRLTSRMNQFERTSLGSNVQYSFRFSEEPYHVGTPPLSGHVDVHHRTRLFLKLEADRLERENLRWRESQAPSSRFLSSWSKNRFENAHSDIVDLSSRSYNY
uniref:Uncharacterized protein n=3 Tax=Knipowitschia caucasica TaxID=637954 RepID=A0AAV2KCA1_KNICA